MYEIKTIRNDADHAMAEVEISRLLNSEDPADAARLDIISDLIWVYEQKRWPIGPPTAVEAILFAMDQRSLTLAPKHRSWLR